MLYGLCSYLTQLFLWHLLCVSHLRSGGSRNPSISTLGSAFAPSNGTEPGGGGDTYDAYTPRSFKAITKCTERSKGFQEGITPSGFQTRASFFQVGGKYSSREAWQRCLKSPPRDLESIPIWLGQEKKSLISGCWSGLMPTLPKKGELPDRDSRTEVIRHEEMVQKKEHRGYWKSQGKTWKETIYRDRDARSECRTSRSRHLAMIIRNGLKASNSEQEY